jgi:hypothetical protein
MILQIAPSFKKVFAVLVLALFLSVGFQCSMLDLLAES